MLEPAACLSPMGTSVEAPSNGGSCMTSSPSSRMLLAFPKMSKGMRVSVISCLPPKGRVGKFTR